MTVTASSGPTTEEISRQLLALNLQHELAVFDETSANSRRQLPRWGAIETGYNDTRARARMQ